MNEKVASIATGKGKYDPSSVAGMGVAVDTIRNRVYVANALTKNITVIDGTDNRMLMNISGAQKNYNQPTDIVINPFTDMAYVVRVNPNVKDTAIMALDLSTNKLELLTFIESANVLAVNPLTNKIYATDTDSNAVQVIDTSKNEKYLPPIRVDDQPTFLAVDQDTNMMYVSNSFSNTVSKIDGDNNKVIFGLRIYMDPPNARYRYML